MLNSNTNILITGVTGLIGGEFVRRLARRGVGKIFCLIRPRPEITAAERLYERLDRSRDASLLEEESSLVPIAGDVTSPRFGMSDEDYAEVTSSVDLIVHCASELSFIRDVSCRETNIAGMRNLIELTRSCRRDPRLVHISTATICGAVHNRCVKESDGDNPNEDHYNEYTRSKAAAEWVLRESGIPALVLRPSIVLSKEVPAENFARAILWFLPLLNEFDAVPIAPASRVDVVTVAFVVESMVRLLEKQRLAYDCYHISAGAHGSMRCGEVAAHLDAYYERTRPLQLIEPSLWTPKMHRQYVATPHQRKVFSTLKHYLPFLNMDVVYDNTRLEQELSVGRLTVPPVKDYVASILDRFSSSMLMSRPSTEARAPRERRAAAGV